ncbi:hypothetical protein [Mesorhizobium sp. M0058]|uniref:hypothetical protein n=1 Tax=Mesorhizobium sp. M0058 TaxID=2956865 RepID=UPI00333DC899
MFQASDTRFEFRLVDDALRLAVDQPADAAPQGGHLSFEADGLDVDFLEPSCPADLCQTGRVVPDGAA